MTLFILNALCSAFLAAINISSRNIRNMQEHIAFFIYNKSNSDVPLDKQKKPLITSTKLKGYHPELYEDPISHTHNKGFTHSIRPLNQKKNFLHIYKRTILISTTKEATITTTTTKHQTEEKGHIFWHIVQSKKKNTTTPQLNTLQNEVAIIIIIILMVVIITI